MASIIKKQGSDLIDLRLTRREMENLIFWIFGVILEDFWRFCEEFWRNLFVEEKKIKNFHQAETERKNLILASKQPRRSNLTSDLEFVAQIAYATMFVWAV